MQSLSLSQVIYVGVQRGLSVLQHGPDRYAHRSEWLIDDPTDDHLVLGRCQVRVTAVLASL